MYIRTSVLPCRGRRHTRRGSTPRSERGQLLGRQPACRAAEARADCVSARGVRRPVWDRRTSRICRLTSATLARTSAVMPNWHVASERRGPAVRPTSVWFVAPGFLAATASPSATTRPFFDSSPAAQWAVSRASRRNDGVSPRSISSPTSRWSASPPCRRRALLAPAVRLGVVVAANCDSDSEAVPVRRPGRGGLHIDSQFHSAGQIAARLADCNIGNAYQLCVHSLRAVARHWAAPIFSPRVAGHMIVRGLPWCLV